jgi:hypothetical protein
MSAFGTKRTFQSRRRMSAIGGKADIDHRCSLSGGRKTKRTNTTRRAPHASLSLIVQIFYGSGTMRQRGRKSAVNLVTLNVDGTPSRLEPSADLSDDERTLFNELVEACSPHHFVKSDLPLLVSFIQSTLLSRRTAHDPSMIAVWEKATRMQATLATRLRLAPQSRMDPKTLARQQAPQGKPGEF